jgi:hypothetical protein
MSTPTEPVIVRAGRLLLIDHGEYSDYSVRGFFVVLRDFAPNERLKAFLTEHVDQQEQYMFDDDAFINALIAQGLLLEIDYARMFTGSYSSMSDFLFIP